VWRRLAPLFPQGCLVAVRLTLLDVDVAAAELRGVVQLRDGRSACTVIFYVHKNEPIETRLDTLYDAELPAWTSGAAARRTSIASTC
jgi:hypothetical protein